MSSLRLACARTWGEVRLRLVVTTDMSFPTTEEQVEAANASGRTPVVFIHGLWLLPSSWDGWVKVFEGAGNAPLDAWLAR